MDYGTAYSTRSPEEICIGTGMGMGLALDGLDDTSF